jgi:hypothetical protein
MSYTGPPHSFIWKRNLDPPDKRIKKILISHEINFFRRTAGYTLTTKGIKKWKGWK